MTAKINAELLKQALIATDDYLGIYREALDKGKATSFDVHDFTARLSVAMEALKKFDELENHNIYIETTITKMAELFKDEDISLFDEPFAHVPSASGEAESVELAGDIIENKTSFKNYLDKNPLKDPLSEEEIEELAQSVQWEDFGDLYTDEELEESTLTEKLSAAVRLKKHMDFARHSAIRGVALSMKIRRPASQDVIARRAKVAARRLLAKRLLQGRDRSQLTAQQKDELESRIKAMGKIQQVLIQKLIPHMRDVERKRLKK
jgi:hypothetical protein